MVILGIDPGIARTGWGLINQQGQQLKSIDYGCFETSSNIASIKRLKQIHQFVTKVSRQYQPDSASIEDLFFNTNAKTAMKVGEARGVILLALYQQKISLFHYTPLQIKTAITSYGRASKNQMQKMVKTILKFNHLPQPDDAADALAAAITHAFTIKNPRTKLR